MSKLQELIETACFLTDKPTKMLDPLIATPEGVNESDSVMVVPTDEVSDNELRFKKSPDCDV